MSDLQQNAEIKTAPSSSFSKNRSSVQKEKPEHNRQPPRPSQRPPPNQPFYPGTRKVIQKQPNSVIQAHQPEYSKTTIQEPSAEPSIYHLDTEFLYQQEATPVNKNTTNKGRKSVPSKPTSRPQKRLMKNPEESTKCCLCVCWGNILYELCTQ